MSRVLPYMSLSKEKIMINSCFNLQFSYCPLIWMFHSRIMNNKINRLHERCMRLIYGDKTSSFEELIERGKSVSIHTRNLQMFSTEMFKGYRSMSPPIFSESGYFSRLILPENIKNFCLLKYSVGKGRVHFFWSALKIFLSKVFDLFF